MKTTAIATLSSKRQITIPASLAKQLELEAGMKLIVELGDDHLILTPQPENFTDALIGSTKNLYGETPEDVNKYLREERAWYE